MKVIHVYRTYFPDPPGGLQEAIRQICLATSALGVESKIFTLTPVPIPNEISYPEGTVVRCRSWASPASCDIGGLNSIIHFRELTAWADVIHYHFPWPFADILHALGGRGKPAIITYHSDIVRQKVINYFYAPLMRRTLRTMVAVVATSPAYLKTSIVLNGNSLAERLRVIPLGIVDYNENNTDANLCGRFGLKAGKPFILSLGVLRYYKGLHTLIEAATSINGTIVIAGSGPEEPKLKALANSLDATNVIFVGQVSCDEKIALLSECRALVLPSHLRSEAFGMVLIEASMFGKPMVCCEIGSGTSYVNIQGETGFVVPPESPKELAQACNRLFNEDDLAVKMGKKARLRYENFFSGEALGHAYSELYKEMINLF